MIHKKGVKKNAEALSRTNHLDEPTNEVGELKITYATELEGD